MSSEPADPFRLLDEASPHPVHRWGPPALGLLTGICLTWLLSPGVRLPALSSIQLWTLAMRWTIPVFVVTAMVAWVASRALSRGAERARAEAALDVGCVATWFPPFLIFYRQQSVWASLIAAVLVAAVTRALLVRYVYEDRPAPETSGSLAPGILAGVSLQMSAIAIGAGDWQSGALALAVASFFLTWILTTRAVWPHPAGRRWKMRKIRVIPAIVLGVSFSAGGLSPYLAHGHGYAANREAEGTERTNARSRERRPQAGGAGAVAIGESYPGVVLWPDVENYVTLVPRLPAPGRTLFDTSKLDSLSIPFFGAYWYFKGPGDPPGHPFVTHGDPAQLSFRSTDFGPLTMEARQNLGRHIDVRCCSSISVTLRNGDRYPGTVSLELELGDTAEPDTPDQSLGVQPVEAGAAQTLTFPMPAALPWPRFDEIAVRFHLLQPRADRSARIAIRRFVFRR